MKDTALPQTEAGIEISTEENDILTKTTSSSLVAIHLQFEGQTIQRVEKDDICTISEIAISGCYSCSKGAMVKVKCEAKPNQRIEATINCGTLGINFVECHKNGHPTQFTVCLQFSQKDQFKLLFTMWKKEDQIPTWRNSCGGSKVSHETSKRELCRCIKVLEQQYSLGGRYQGSSWTTDKLMEWTHQLARNNHVHHRHNHWIVDGLPPALMFVFVRFVFGRECRKCEETEDCGVWKRSERTKHINSFILMFPRSAPVAIICGSNLQF
ncbi:hypothetical protein L5515_019374 [Caenorhabditis briggsae]|uniref:Phlebovirus glycoprotein G2 fusion domain-containing protein n=1 Tax=Caenorhabditis briggsae TaxID=6238 RepID=A0AAE9FLU8_CAEBR|nr:hypothetical protein L5515_019374 [Caenorhabditis briggsae]